MRRRKASACARFVSVGLALLPAPVIRARANETCRFRQAMVEDTLDGARCRRYRRAAWRLAGCRALAAISDYGIVETHETFAASLHAGPGTSLVAGIGRATV
jgi:hypothetical protein